MTSRNQSQKIKGFNNLSTENIKENGITNYKLTIGLIKVHKKQRLMVDINSHKLAVKSNPNLIL